MNHRQAKKFYRKHSQDWYEWTVSIHMDLSWGQLKKLGFVPAPKRWRARARWKWRDFNYEKRNST